MTISKLIKLITSKLLDIPDDHVDTQDI